MPKTMTTYVALLRAVNVGGRALVSMAALRDLAAGLGLGQPQTLLQSGNLVFEAPATSTASLEGLLQEATARRFGLQTDIVVRTAREWDRVVGCNPFPAEAANDPGHLLLMALKGPAKAGGLEALRAAIEGREVVKGEGAHLYLVYPDGVGRSKLTSAVIEKAIGTRGTSRNWNTVLKVAALWAAAPPGNER